jgi:uncharacterized protein YecA (UPF0149 family)
MNILDQPLSDTEIETLDAFLMSDSTSDEVLAIDELVVPIAVLARLGDDDRELQQSLGDQEKIVELTEAVAESAAAIYEYSRSVADGPSQPHRRHAAKVGRNHPCPCGSGKKHKKCCGAGANLHRAPVSLSNRPPGYTESSLS